jgi:hypothetical protein
MYTNVHVHTHIQNAPPDILLTALIEHNSNVIEAGHNAEGARARAEGDGGVHGHILDLLALAEELFTSKTSPPVSQQHQYRQPHLEMQQY